MKKLVSMLLALAMILAMSTTAFAAENTTLTIKDSTDRTYNGYQLLNLTVSLKSDCDCAEGATHTDTCYNYAYTVNDKYKAILQKQAGDGKDIIAYFASLSSDTDDAYGTLREAADKIYRAIKADTSITPDKTGLTGTSNIGQGYWLFADVTNLTGDDDANSLVIVDTKGLDELTISPKVGLPTVEKKVKDINDSTGETSDWQDSADHDIGDTVSFQLTATLPSNIAGYETYKIVFHDTLDAGLTLDPDTIKVYMYASADDAETGTSSTEVTSSFTPINSTPTDGCTFEIGCDNVLAIDGVNKDTVFVVYYEATLNENAKIGAAGNSNKVYLEFSNDPYSDSTGKTAEDKVTVFTYKLVINKTDAEGNALKGAGFTLYKKNTSGEYVSVGDELKGAEMTTFEWEGLDDGNYKLVESTVPDGYNKMTDIEFTITAEHEEKSADPKLTSLNGGAMGTGVVETGTITKAIENKTGTVLPETGAEGTMMLITGGAMFVIVAAVFMVTRKKMSIYED